MTQQISDAILIEGDPFSLRWGIPFADQHPPIFQNQLMPKIFRIFESTRLIGLAFLVAGCCTDFDGWFHIGTILRGTSGIIGAHLLLGILDHNGMGYLGSLLIGLLLYLFTIRSGPLPLFTVPYFDLPLVIDGWLKISLRIIGAVFFIMGYKSTIELSR